MDATQVLSDLLDTSGLSQAEVARRVGVRAQSVTNWKTGVSKPSADNVRQLDLVLDAGGRIMRAYGYDPGTPDGICTIEGAIRSDNDLNSEDKRLLLGIVERLRERHVAPTQ
jgi:transcriptional regulator with XRE-family HTH domain